MTAQTRREAPRARYHGLTQRQVRALLEIDELARGAYDAEHVAEVTRRWAKDLGRPLVPPRMLEYAKEAEAAGKNGVACAWYKAIARDSTANVSERGAFRAFLVRVGWLEEATKRGYDLTPEELRPIAERRLREAGPSPSDNQLRSALDIYATKLRDRDGIARVLKRAVQLGRHDVAARAANALDRLLTQAELLRIARYLLQHDTMYFRDAAAYIAEHGLRALYRTLIERMAGSQWVRFASLRTWARRLDVPLTMKLLERYHRGQRRYGLGVQDIVASAHALARRSPVWRRRLPELYAWCRQWGLGYESPETAERYGQKCGQPLTVAELQAMAEHLGHSDIAHIDWARRRRAFCLRLASERIAAATGAPPDPPARKLAAAA
jgi:hypothetical protein